MGFFLIKILNNGCETLELFVSLTVVVAVVVVVMDVTKRAAYTLKQ